MSWEDPEKRCRRGGEAVKTCTIAEQIIDDPVSGLTFHFKSMRDGTSRLYVSGDILPLGNREFHFQADGLEGAAGFCTRSSPCPSWLRLQEEANG